MNTTLGEIYADSTYRLGKDFRGGYNTPALFNQAIRVINQRKMNDLVDVFEKNGEVTADLQQFIKTRGGPQYPPLSFTAVLASDVNKGGYAEIPEDFWYQVRANYSKTVNTACTSTSVYRPVRLLKQHEFEAAMQDSNDSPVQDPVNNYPVMVIQNNLFYVYPYINRCSFTYISEPTQPYFDYDIVSGYPVYLPPGQRHVNSSVEAAGSLSLSVEFEYSESLVDSLTDMIVTYIARVNESVFTLQTQNPPKN